MRSPFLGVLRGKNGSRDGRKAAHGDGGSGFLCWRVRGNLLAGEAAFLAGTVGIAGAGVVGGVGPFTLDLPLGAVGEGHQRRAESPCALVSVFLALRVVPGAGAGGVGARFGEFVAAHVGDRRQTLGVQPGSILRVAAGIAVKLEEVGKLDANPFAGAHAVIGAVAGVAARSIGIDSVVAVAGGIGVGDHLAHLVKNRLGVAAG